MRDVGILQRVLEREMGFWASGGWCHIGTLWCFVSCDLWCHYGTFRVCIDKTLGLFELEWDSLWVRECVELWRTFSVRLGGSSSHGI